MTATVLVIDDDPTVRESIAAFLVDYDYEVATATSANNAWEVLEQTAVDIAVCDLRMPGVSGIEWLEQVRDRQPSLPVIVVSGAGVMDDVVKALRLGASDFLVKPILDLEVLHHSISRALERTRLEQENQAYRQHLERNNAELKRGLDELRKDQLAGRQIQMRMLPDPLDAGEYHCEHRLFPSLLLSGDFLDFFELDDNQLIFYIADVSGHGASSAFVTVLLKNLTYRLRRNFHRGSSDDLLYPSRVLDRINSELLATGLDKHLTMFYGIIDRETGTLSYSTGGHLPMPVLLTPDGAQYIEGRGMAVGLFPEAEFKTRTMELPQEYRILMFSDGILEIMQQSALAEKEACLLELIESESGDLDGLTQKLNLDSDNEVPDDIAMVVIGRGEL